MQRPPADDSCSSSFSSTDLDMQLARQEELLVERYGRLRLKQLKLCGKKQTRQFFDSADWQLQKQGKLSEAAAIFLGYDSPIDQLPVKSEPTAPSQRQRSHLDAVGWAQPVRAPVAQRVTVIDI